MWLNNAYNESILCIYHVYYDLTYILPIAASLPHTRKETQHIPHAPIEYDNEYYIAMLNNCLYIYQVLYVESVIKKTKV